MSGHTPPNGVQSDGFPSPGRVAWDAWGSDAGKRWGGSIDV